MNQLAQLFLIISPDKFHLLKFLLEAYDNLCIISSFQSEKGVVLVRYNHGNAQEIMEILSSLAIKMQAFDI